MNGVSTRYCAGCTTSAEWPVIFAVGRRVSHQQRDIVVRVDAVRPVSVAVWPDAVPLRSRCHPTSRLLRLGRGLRGSIWRRLVFSASAMLAAEWTCDENCTRICGTLPECLPRG